LESLHLSTMDPDPKHFSSVDTDLLDPLNLSSVHPDPLDPIHLSSVNPDRMDQLHLSSVDTNQWFSNILVPWIRIH